MSVTIIVRGKHDTGRTTIASLFRMFLEENGYRDVTVADTEPLSHERKADFTERFKRNRSQPVKILVETVE